MSSAAACPPAKLPHYGLRRVPCSRHHQVRNARGASRPSAQSANAPPLPVSRGNPDHSTSVQPDATKPQPSTPSNATLSRRSLCLIAAAALSGLPHLPLSLSAPPPSQAAESLFQRISSPSPPRAPFGALPFAPTQLYYPKWMFGEWEVTSRLLAASSPLGAKLLPRSAAPLPEDPQSEPPTSYRLRFYSTLADTLENQVLFNLGILPTDSIIQDRAWNTRAVANAVAGYEAVVGVAYDPREAPGKETVTFASLAPDMRPLPPRRIELFLNNLRSESRFDEEDGTEEFATSEVCRQVALGAGQVDVQDYEVINSYRRGAGGAVAGRQRVAVYLNPQDEGYFQAGGRAVQVFDYEVGFQRVPVEGAAACVETPKDVIQCI